MILTATLASFLAAVALSLAAVGYSRLFSFLVALLTGLIEPVGGFLSIGLN